MGILFTSCDKDNIKTDKEDIEAYLAKNNIDATEQESGIYYASIEEGTGDSPNVLSNVEVTYKGSYLDDFIFDQTENGQTATFSLQGVIPGFREGILLMKKGGKAKIFIPSRLGYGSNPPGSVRKDAILIFDVELIDF